jgi:membrane-associated phospholipid phosphatase
MGEWLYSLIPWGTDAILWAQTFRTSLLDGLFVGATYLGEEYFYIGFLPLIYWCVSKELGVRLSYLIMLSNYFNGWAKLLYKIPRPADSNIVSLRHEASPSFPSGHSQNAASMWCYLALYVKRMWFWVFVIGLILLIAMSRVYVGVHFPQDLIGGLLLGVTLLVLYVTLGDRVIAPWLRRQSLGLRLVLGAIVPLIMLFIYPRDYAGHYPAEIAATVVGVLIGISIGAPLEERHVRFSVAGSFWKRLLRLLLGMALIVLIYAGPKLLLPELPAPGLNTTIRVLRYALMAFTLTFIAPYIFVRVKLADRTP